MTEQRFTWRADKRARNIADHGIDFTEAIHVFEDPYAVVEYSPRGSEERWVIIGLAFPRILFVVYTERFEGTLHIISARKALPHERRYYESHRK